MLTTPLISAFQRQEQTLLNTWAYKGRAREQAVKANYEMRTLINRERLLRAVMTNAGSEGPEILRKSIRGA